MKKQKKGCTGFSANNILKTIFVILIPLQLDGQIQTLDLDVYQAPLNAVLQDLNDKYNIELSYNDAELAEFLITRKSKYESIDALLKDILRDLPFQHENQDGVYIIFKSENKLEDQAVLSTTLVSGIVRDDITGESLPYSTVKINGEFRISDVNGKFSFISFYREFLKIEVSHLGYRYYDTTIVARKQFICSLHPVVNVLDEAIITGTKKRYGVQAGMSIGQARMNPRLSSFLPGGSTIGIQQILNVQSGISAAPNGFSTHSTWGGYPGQNQVLYDGISIYNFPNASMYIYPVNPLVVKDVVVNKGAFGSNYGDRVGGITVLTGKDGSTKKTDLSALADGSALNMTVSAPVNAKTSFSVAGRKTWAHGYARHFSDKAVLRNSSPTYKRIPLLPDYKDVNIKLSGGNNKGDRFHISVYGSSEKRSVEAFSDNAPTMGYFLNNRLDQLGSAFLYDKIWDNGINTIIKLSSSQATKKTSNKITTRLLNGEDNVNTGSQKINNYKLSLVNRFPLNPKQFVEAGGSLQFISTDVDLPVSDTSLISNSSGHQLSGFVRNHIYVNSHFLMDIGVRADYHNQPEQLSIFPRIKGTIRVSTSSQLNFSWGVHQQYIVLAPVIDLLGNTGFVWRGFDKKSNFLQSNILAVGWSFQKRSWNINTELYTKSVEGNDRIRYNGTSFTYQKGRSVSNGLDITLKKELGKHLLMQTYHYNTLKAKYDADSPYITSAYNREHELKTVALFNFEPVRISFTHVYGSPTGKEEGILSFGGDYKRLDAMIAYKYENNNLNIDFGMSAYNIFDNTNVSSLRARQIKWGDDNYSLFAEGGMPFFPSAFIKINF